MWTQIVGKTRLAFSPMLNHWRQVLLYVTLRGLSTGSMPYVAGACEVVFDFHHHERQPYTSDGKVRRIALAPRPAADFYHEYRDLLRAAGVAATIWPVPVENATPLPQAQHHRSYDADAAQRFWQIMLRADQLLGEFRGHFTGKASPVHFFWGSFDLAGPRFSSRPAPLRPCAPAACPTWPTG